MSKEDEIYKLVLKRRNDPYIGYHTIGEYHNGKYECDYVSPYSTVAHNPNSNIMIMAQDWASDDILNKPFNPIRKEFGYDPDVLTNINLHNLLSKFNINFKDTYSTNLFPFIKNGRKNSRIPMTDMIRSAVDYGIPEINIIQPQIVICLGIAVFNSLKVASGSKKCKNIEYAFNNSFKIGVSNIEIQAHTGMLGKNNRNKGGINRVDSDWNRMFSKYSCIKK